METLREAFRWTVNKLVVVLFVLAVGVLLLVLSVGLTVWTREVGYDPPDRQQDAKDVRA